MLSETGISIGFTFATVSKPSVEVEGCGVVSAAGVASGVGLVVGESSTEAALGVVAASGSSAAAVVVSSAGVTDSELLAIFSTTVVETSSTGGATVVSTEVAVEVATSD